MAHTETSNIAAIRSLVLRFDADELAFCVEQQISDYSNRCYPSADPIQAANVLSKASFVKKQVQQGLSLPQAMRELGRRMRIIQGNEP